MKEKKIVLVSAGTEKEKNGYKNYEAESLYLNLGLLGLATRLKEKGYSVCMLQGNRRSPEEVLKELEKYVIPDSDYPLFLSIPSFYQVSWAEKFVKRVKERYGIKIVAGGRWVIDRNLDWIKNKMPGVDFFIKGCPDECIDLFLWEENWNSLKGECYYKHPFKCLDYTVLKDYRRYQPVIEVARGCPGGCSFCLESNYKACRPKSPVAVLDEAQKICGLYQDNRLNFYFEGAIFSPDRIWAEQFLKEYRKRELQFQFRMQSRVDAIRPEVVKLLAKAGLKVLDVGLESASVVQLTRMGKTKVPEEYLEKAERLLYAAAEAGVWCKLNLLFYAGETQSTLAETKKWLKKMKPYFKGISCNPLTIYLNGDATWSYVEQLEQLSGTEISRELLQRDGYVMFDLSRECMEKDIKRTVNEFYEEFMSPEEYMQLKKITYTEREL